MVEIFALDRTSELRKKGKGTGREMSLTMEGIALF